jgi:hypothetical protein
LPLGSWKLHASALYVPAVVCVVAVRLKSLAGRALPLTSVALPLALWLLPS